MEKKLIKNQQGFSVAEILVAIILFSIFGTGFFINQSGNITNSTRMGEMLILHNLCERKINEIMILPPEFNETTDSDIEEKNFEEEQYQDFRYKIEYKKLELPSFKKLMEAQGNGEDEEENEDPQDATSQAYIGKVFEKIQENLNKILWQVRVTVENTKTKRKLTLSSWIEDKNQKVEIKL